MNQLDQNESPATGVKIPAQTRFAFLTNLALDFTMLCFACLMVFQPAVVGYLSNPARTYIAGALFFLSLLRLVRAIRNRRG